MAIFFCLDFAEEGMGLKWIKIKIKIKRIRKKTIIKH
jgi:hypothetical protein